MVKAQKQTPQKTKEFEIKKQQPNYYLIDIIRVILAFIIVNVHSYNEYHVQAFGTNAGGGWLVCDAFFIISGFFCAASALKKESLPWWKFAFRKVFNLLPMICIAWIQGLIFSGILALSNHKANALIPFFGSHWALWFIWSMWVAEFIFYALLKYTKNWKYPLSAIVCLIGLAGYIFFEVYTKYGAVSNNGLAYLQKYSRGLFGIGVGIFIYVLNEKFFINKKPNSALKTIFTILAFAAAGGCCYCMFFQYKTPWLFMAVGLFIPILIICFWKLGWISSSLVLPKRVSAFFRKYSLSVYLYHQALIMFISCFYFAFPSQIACSATCFCCAAVNSVIFYLFAPRLSSWFISKCKHLNKI